MSGNRIMLTQSNTGVLETLHIIPTEILAAISMISFLAVAWLVLHATWPRGFPSINNPIFDNF